MKLKKILSSLLAVLMLVGALPLTVGAEEETKEYTYRTNSYTSLMNYNKASEDDDTLDKYYYKTGKYTNEDGVTDTVDSAEEKLSLMDYRYGTDRYELYIDAFSGEVAVRDKVSGELLFTNPYDVANAGTNDESTVKNELLSQLVVHYTDIASNTSGTLESYVWAANRNQIVVKNINGGIRVEYTIGRVESRSLLPRMIEKSAMDEIFEIIQTNMEKAIEEGKVLEEDVADERHRFTQFQSYYGTAMSLENAVNEEMKTQMLNEYPVLERMDIYVLDDAEIGETTVKKLENLLKQYYPEYTFEDLDAHHMEVEYEGTKESSPLFKMALEYTLDEKGLVVRLPANGIRFNETLYRLDNIEILPYMGAGSNPNPGYTFFPDGSGTLFDFEDIAILGTRQLISGTMYGQDFAYHEIEGMYEEILRYPVFGITETQTVTENVTDEEGNVTDTRTYEKDRGFVAIIEQGDSLMKLTSYHAGQTSKYNTVKISVFPRPTDSYNVADAISVGSNSEWTVVSARKYTGSYQVRYLMLTDDEVAEQNDMTDAYECSYVGMAKAYRDYLEENGTLTRLTAEDVKEDIPLYVETFGALQTTEKFLSIPVNVMTPLTSFGDVATMYDELAEEEITNVNFILTGYTKGGMTGATVPYNLKWERAVSKEMDFDELTEYATDKEFGLYPDFDFVFASNNKLFDGLTLKDHAVKTIDNRYTSKREYSATKHTYVSYFELALSPAYFSHFYEKFVPKFKKDYDPIGISVSTLGSYLNSDFDEDEPYNRADGQEYTIEAFRYLDEELANTKILTSGGNAYCWKYVDHITDIALDSSRFSVSSASVPFLGIVLHGYVELAGTPINMEGNLDYAFLKALENGAALNFILSYRNTENLKEYETLSQYYSVRYDIWFEDMVSMYHELNALLKDVQTSRIVHHEFLNAAGVRVPDDDELAADAAALLQEQIAATEAAKAAAEQAYTESLLEARLAVEQGTAAIKNNTLAADAAAFTAKLAECQSLLTDAIAKEDAYKKAQENHADTKRNNSSDPAITATLEKDGYSGTRETRDLAKNAAIEAVTKLNTAINELYPMATAFFTKDAELKQAYTDAKAGMALLEQEQAFTAEYRESLKAMMDDDFDDAYQAIVDAKYDELLPEMTEYAASIRAFKKTITDHEADKSKSEYATSAGKISAIWTTAADFSYTAPTPENSGSGPVDSMSGSSNATQAVLAERYQADKNTIVYEVYENGAAFLLNFNDYRVVVELNGMKYTVDAYGYVVLSRPTN